MRLEVAVDDPAGLRAAVEGGADRIELCSALDVGGLTPSAGLMRLAAGCGLPVLAMIRPRSGGFCYDGDELAVMASDIAAARMTGLAGVVLGALTPELRLDLPAMEGLMRRAAGLEVTLHRAFDLIDNWREAVDQAVALGVNRILTVGRGALGPGRCGADGRDHGSCGRAHHHPARRGDLCRHHRRVAGPAVGRSSCLVPGAGGGGSGECGLWLCPPGRETVRRGAGQGAESRIDRAAVRRESFAKIKGDTWISTLRSNAPRAAPDRGRSRWGGF